MFNKKIYLVVYACEPNQGGEHEVGWKIANELAGKCDLIVVTRKSNKRLIEQYSNTNSNIDFRYIENDMFLHFKPKGRFSYMYYLFWQLSVFYYLKNIVSKKDIVHYLTFGNIHLPHFLFLLKSKLIIGPMGGGSVVDTRLMRHSTLKTKIKSIVHRLVNLTVLINPIYYILFSKSSKIILRTNETLQIIPKIFHSKCDVFLETGIDATKLQTLSKKRKLKKIITTASIIESKNIDQVVEVFKKLVELTNDPLELSIVGDGPMRSILEAKYSSVTNLQFLGKIPHEKVEFLLRESDLFLFCSIKEGGSHSLFEASMNSCPIACYDVSGMMEFPKNDYAIKIKPTRNIDENIKFLAEKIHSAFGKNQVDDLCQKAIVDLKANYDWQKIANHMIKIYNDIANKGKK